MKSRFIPTVAVALSALFFVACQKPPAPTNPAAPDPKAEAPAADSSSGTTTNFENPTPAEPPRQ